MAKRKVNPWAVCHKATGPKKDSKHERCVMQVKAKHGIKEVKMNKNYERMAEVLYELTINLDPAIERGKRILSRIIPGGKARAAAAAAEKAAAEKTAAEKAAAAKKAEKAARAAKTKQQWDAGEHPRQK